MVSPMNSLQFDSNGALTELVAFKWLMAGRGWWVDVPRFRRDMAYAQECAQKGRRKRPGTARAQQRRLAGADAATDTAGNLTPHLPAMSRKPFSHIRVLDLSRVIAGPLAAQMLGDLGAEVIKVERAGGGDDARKMGPPFLKDREGRDTRETPIILGSNRNKKSITLDLARARGPGASCAGSRRCRTCWSRTSRSAI